MRLNKFLAHAGVASRRKCDEIIASGKVKEDVTSGTSVVFEEVSGKFIRGFQNYIDYITNHQVYS